MDRTDIINYYLSVKPIPTFYLEIGVRDTNANFNCIVATSKVGVDSDKKCKCNYKMTSDDFFEKNFPNGYDTQRLLHKPVVLVLARRDCPAR
jgi:hypothetical protein